MRASGHMRQQYVHAAENTAPRIAAKLCGFTLGEHCFLIDVHLQCVNTPRLWSTVRDVSRGGVISAPAATDLLSEAPPRTFDLSLARMSSPCTQREPRERFACE